MRKPWPILCGMLWATGFWFRVFGYGVRIMLERYRQTSFAPGRVICGMNVLWLKPDNS